MTDVLLKRRYDTQRSTQIQRRQRHREESNVKRRQRLE